MIFSIKILQTSVTLLVVFLLLIMLNDFKCSSTKYGVCSIYLSVIANAVDQMIFAVKCVVIVQLSSQSTEVFALSTDVVCANVILVIKFIL